MTTANLTAPERRVLDPFCFVIHRSGRWVGVCRFGNDEHHTPKRFGTRAAALADARRIAAVLVRADSAQPL
jgi:hypothetical protein